MNEIHEAVSLLNRGENAEALDRSPLQILWQLHCSRHTLVRVAGSAPDQRCCGLSVVVQILKSHSLELVCIELEHAFRLTFAYNPIGFLNR